MTADLYLLIIMSDFLYNITFNRNQIQIQKYKEQGSLIEYHKQQQKQPFKSITYQKFHQSDFISFSMYFHSSQQQMTFNQILTQVKVKNKQIQFLQDKIILMQKQRQSKLNEIQHRYQTKIQNFIETNDLLDSQNTQLRNKVQKYRHKITSLNQKHKNLTTQINLLTSTQSNTSKQSKIYKSKYQKQKRQSSRVQQQSLHLQHLVNIMQRQLHQLSNKNTRLLQEKNILMNTYNDYDQIKYKLQEIQNVYCDQYQSQIEIIKKRMRNQLEENTRQITKEMMGGRNMRDEGESGLMMVRTKSVPHLGKINEFQDQNNKETVKLCNPHIQTHYIQPTNSNPPTRDYQQTSCINCLLQKSWQQDIISLKNCILYGADYILSMNRREKLEQNRQQQYKITKLNHTNSQKIVNFIISVLKQNKSLSTQINQTNIQLINTKQQLKQMRQQFQNKFMQMMKDIQTIQKQSKQKQIIERQNMKQIQNHKAKIEIKNIQFIIKQNIQKVQKLTEILVEIISRLLQKQYFSREKCQLMKKVYLMNVQHNQSNDVLVTQDKDRITKLLNKSRHTYGTISKSITKFRSIVKGILFIQVLKKQSDTTRRKVNLRLGGKSRLKNKSISSQQFQQKSIHSRIMKNVVNNTSSQINSISTGYITNNKSLNFNKFSHNILKKCIYEIKLSSLIKPKIQQNKNIYIKQWFNQTRFKFQEELNKLKNNQNSSTERLKYNPQWINDNQCQDQQNQQQVIWKNTWQMIKQQVFVDQTR